MPSTKKEEVSYEFFLKTPAAGKVSLASFRVVLFRNSDTKLLPDYVQKVDREIQFLWQYCAFASEDEFTELLLNYFFSETRVPNLRTYPFSKVHIITPSRTYQIDKFRFDLEEEKTKFGLVDSLFVGSEFGVYRLRIAPGKEIPDHIHHVMEEKEIVLTDGLELNGKRIPAGTINVWPYGTPHRYKNTTKVEQCILCIDKPAFDADDEVLV